MSETLAVHTAGTTGFHIAREDLQALEDRITGLQASGWKVTAQSPTALTMTYECADLDGGISSLRGLGSAYLNVRIIGRLDHHEVVLRLSPSGSVEIDRLPHARPEDIFEDDFVGVGQQAWDGDAESVTRLPFTWEMSASLELARSLQGVGDSDVRVLLYPTEIESSFSNLAISDLGRYIPHSGRRCYIFLRGTREPLHLGAVSFTSLAHVPAEGLEIPPRVEPLPGERARLDALGDLPAPADLLRIDGEDSLPSWARVLVRCEAAAVFLTWMMAASNHELTGDGLRLRFVGYKPTWLEYPNVDDLSADQIRDGLRFRHWLFSDDSPDRVLAVRYVMSLYPDHAEFPVVGDIQAGAETIYFGLRSTAIAEEVASLREAQNHAQEAVRQALKSTQDMLKVLTERFMATLVGIGGVVIGKATQALTDDASRFLMLLIGVFALALALFSIAFEGPIVGLPIRCLATQVEDGYPLLTPVQRDTIVRGRSVTKTRQLVLMVRLVVPASYVLLFIAILFFGHPERYL